MYSDPETKGVDGQVRGHEKKRISQLLHRVTHWASSRPARKTKHLSVFLYFSKNTNKGDSVSVSIEVHLDSYLVATKYHGYFIVGLPIVNYV